jgi:hypothetical protein
MFIKAGEIQVYPLKNGCTLRVIPAKVALDMSNLYCLETFRGKFQFDGISFKGNYRLYGNLKDPNKFILKEEI